MEEVCKACCFVTFPVCHMLLSHGSLQGLGGKPNAEPEEGCNFTLMSPEIVQGIPLPAPGKNVSTWPRRKWRQRGSGNLLKVT